MTDGTASPPGHASEVVRLGQRASRASAFEDLPISGTLDPQQIRSVLAMYLAGDAVPRAVFEYALQEVCRLIEEERFAASSEPR